VKGVGSIRSEESHSVKNVEKEEEPEEAEREKELGNCRQDVSR
jgi:hypothetical protein